jgi:crotonobetainyl-CoA:carnitine CoA-transferase CaiB-like acyl-CoA transferase
VLLVMPQPDPYWPRFCAAIGTPEWAADPRYDSLAKRRDETATLTPAIQAAFATHPRAYWMERLDAHGLIWAPVATLPEVIADPQARAMGWITTIDHPTFGPFETVGTPFHIAGADVGPRGGAPEAGAHTFEVLAELGVDDDELARLAADGVIG